MDLNAVQHYDVFLSYRHKPRDSKICKKVHTLLETFKPPRKYKQADIKRVFRDNEELPAAGVLSDTIEEALKNSRILLVICSPDTPQSQWVDREVRTFMELGRSDKIFSLLIAGDAENSFPPSLRLVPGIENRTLRIQAGSEQSNRKLKKELLKIVAAATDTPCDPLRIAVGRRRLRRSIFAAAALSLFLFASGFYSLYQWTKASYYNLVAQREELVIHDVINSITFDLTKAVNSLPGASGALAAILSANIEYMDRMMAIDGSSEKTQTDKGNNYLSLARAYLMEGDYDKASESAQQAIILFEDLAEDSTDLTIIKELAISYNIAGLYMQSMSKWEDAVDFLGKAADVYKELSDLEPEADHPASRADCLNNLAVCYYLKGDYKNAADMFIEEMKLRKKSMGKDPSYEDQRTLADLAATIGSCLMSAQEYKRAESYHTQAMSLYKSLFEETPDASSHKSYVTALYALGRSQAFAKKDKEAEYNLRLSVVEADKLTRESLPDFDPLYLCMYAMYDLLYGDESKREEALNIASEAYNIHATDPFIRLTYAYSLLFNGHATEALEELRTFMHEDVSNTKVILQDIELFIIRDRTTEDLLHLRETLSLSQGDSSLTP